MTTETIEIPVPGGNVGMHATDYILSITDCEGDTTTTEYTDRREALDKYVDTCLAVPVFRETAPDVDVHVIRVLLCMYSDFPIDHRHIETTFVCEHQKPGE